MDEDKSLRDASTPDAIRLAPSPKRADVSPFRRFAIAVVGAGARNWRFAANSVRLRATDQARNVPTHAVMDRSAP